VFHIEGDDAVVLDSGSVEAIGIGGRADGQADSTYRYPPEP
jgi:hypothetical protein